MPSATPSLVDIGINLSNSSFAHDYAKVVDNGIAAGVEKMLITGTSLSESQQTLALVQELSPERPNCLFTTAGVHPHDAKSWEPHHRKAFRELLDQPEVIAVGECGLDFNRDFSPRPVQEQVFAEHLSLASETKLPLFLHERDAHERFIGIWREHRDTITAGGVVHCFTGSEAALRAYLDEGFYIGITGWVCDERRGEELQRLVPMIPDDRLLIETDGPYLLPRDLKPKPKSRRNEPIYLPHIATTIARLRGQSPDAVATRTTANACQLFSM